MAEKNVITLKDMSLINPLIDETGDEVKIKSVLKFISNAFIYADPKDGLSLDFNECCGLAYLLQTCTAAMDASRHGFQKGDAA